MRTMALAIVVLGAVACGAKTELVGEPEGVWCNPFAGEVPPPADRADPHGDFQCPAMWVCYAGMRPNPGLVGAWCCPERAEGGPPGNPAAAGCCGGPSVGNPCPP